MNRWQTVALIVGVSLGLGCGGAGSTDTPPPPPPTYTIGRTVSGLTGSGLVLLAIDGPSPTIAGGMVFVSSGYGVFGQTPGNVLLAFGLKSR